MTDEHVVTAPPVECPNCQGFGWIEGSAWIADCCGEFLPSGECCAAKYGGDRMVEVEVQAQVDCPMCGGRGTVE